MLLLRSFCGICFIVYEQSEDWFGVWFAIGQANSSIKKGSFMHPRSPINKPSDIRSLRRDRPKNIKALPARRNDHTRRLLLPVQLFDFRHVMHKH